jgi:hypothetical protein
VASDQVLKQLYQTLEKLEKVDVQKVLRKNLGDESLDLAFSPQLTKINRLHQFVKQYAPAVHDQVVNQARSTFDAITDLMTKQAERASPEYISERETFLQQVESHLNNSLQWRPAFVTTAVEERGFLEDEGIRQEYAKAVEKLQQESAATLKSVKEEANKALQEAKALAEEIETRARRTATKISVQEAQQQFQTATTDSEKAVTNWARACVATTTLLIAVAAAFMWWPLPDPGTWPVALYHTLLRIVVLSATAAVSAFTFRMLRAHMHMAEKNRHRVRIANSVESFVNSALEPQQRDLLLAKLAGEIIDFGESGIIRGQADDHDSSVVSADMLGRILATLTSRKT